MLAAFFDKLLAHPRSVLVITVAFTALCFVGLGGLTSSNDYRSYLDDDYPGILQLEEVESQFVQNKGGSILVVPKQGDIFTQSGLAVLRELTEAVWDLPRLTRVDSIANFQHTRADGDDLFVADLIPLDETIDAAMVEQVKAVSLSDPSTRNLLIAADASMSVLALTFEFDSSDSIDQLQRDEVAHATIALLDDYRARYPEFTFSETGTFFGDFYSDQYLAEINTHLMPVMLLVMMGLLTLLLRSLSGLLAATVVVIGSGVITMGLFGWGNMLLEAVAAMGPIVIMTLAVADSVHIIVGAQAAYGQGMSKEAAIKESLRINFMPVFLTSLTTALGVITFAFTDFPSLRKLGVIIALGVAVAFILSVTILPVLLNYLPLKKRAPDALESKIYRRLVDFSIRRARLILPLALVTSLVLASNMMRGEVDESFQELFKNDTEIGQSINLIEDKMAGMLQLDVAIFTEQADAVTDPEFLRLLDNFRIWALKQDNVTHVQTISDTFKRLNRSMHGDQQAFYRLPDSPQLAAQYLLLYEMSLPIGLDLSYQLSLDKSATRVAVSARNVRSKNVLKLRDDVRSWFAENAPQHRVIATGLVTLMSEVTTYELAPKMARGAMLALLMVSLVLFFALRSWVLGTLGMLANVIPIAVGYGIWALSGQLYNFVAISVAGICLGMVIDFAVHFLDKFRHARKQGRDVETSIRYAYEKVAGPLTITAIVLMAGFFVLSFTKTATFAGLGLLTPLIILLALVFDLLVLPALIIAIYRRAS